MSDDFCGNLFFNLMFDVINIPCVGNTFLLNLGSSATQFMPKYILHCDFRCFHTFHNLVSPAWAVGLVAIFVRIIFVGVIVFVSFFKCDQLIFSELNSFDISRFD